MGGGRHVGDDKPREIACGCFRPYVVRPDAMGLVPADDFPARSRGGSITTPPASPGERSLARAAAQSPHRRPSPPALYLVLGARFLEPRLTRHRALTRWAGQRRAASRRRRGAKRRARRQPRTGTDQRRRHGRATHADSVPVGRAWASRTSRNRGCCCLAMPRILTRPSGTPITKYLLARSTISIPS